MGPTHGSRPPITSLAYMSKRLRAWDPREPALVSTRNLCNRTDREDLGDHAYDMRYVLMVHVLLIRRGSVSVRAKQDNMDTLVKKDFDDLSGPSKVH